MRKTLLLVFIHGFKGGDDTFGTFPEHFRALISHALPKIDVVAITYPKFETRGELKDCVERFREWLQNKVIDLEVAHSAPSPTVDPSVHTVLIGHSMGGIVAAETLLLLANDQPLSFTSSPKASNFPSNTTLNSTTGTSHPTYNQKSPFNNTTTKASSSPKIKPQSSSDSPNSQSGSLTFPHITGLLAFDTPFLGISPGVIAHGAEGHYKTASTAYSAFSELSSAFGWGGSSSTSPNPSGKSTPTKSSQPAGLLTNGGDAAASPRWQSWGKYAMFAGAAGVAAGGAAALYSQREKLSSGWGWIGGHLEFVGCLMRAEELRGRVEKVGALSRNQSQNQGNEGAVGKQKADVKKSEAADVVQRGFGGSANFYSRLGRGANTVTDTSTKILLDGATREKRTFVRLPAPKLPPLQGSSTDQKNKPKSITSDSNSEGRKGMKWVSALNDKATDEITAHTSMFYPRDNPGFYGLGEQAKEVVVGWVMARNAGWYESSTTVSASASSAPPGTKDQTGGKRKPDGGSGGGKTYGEVGDDGWEKPDYEDEAVKVKRREKDGDLGKGSGGSTRGATGISDPVWVQSGDGEEDVSMRDGSADAEDLESSVVVDRAG